MIGDAKRGSADVVTLQDKCTWEEEDHPTEKAEKVHEVDTAHDDADAGSDGGGGGNDGSGVAAADGTRADTDERDSTRLALHSRN